MILVRLALTLAVVIAWPQESMAEESELAGFTPIKFDQSKMEAHLFERVYHWKNSMLPNEVISRSKLAGSIKAAYRIANLWRQRLLRKLLFADRRR